MAHALSQTFAGFNLSETFTGVLEKIRTARAKRAAYNEVYFELSSLSDRELDDIGIYRGDIKRIAQEHVS